MKILAITDLYPTNDKPQRGIFIKHSLKYLSKLCEVHLIQPQKHQKAKEHDGKLTVHRIPYKDPYLVREFSRAWSMKKGVESSAMELAANINFDLILGIFTVPGGWLAAKIAKKINKPFVVVGLGSDIHLFHDHFILGNMTVSTLRKADMLIVNAKNLKEKAISLKVAPEKIRVLPFGFDKTVFHPTKDIPRSIPPMILMVANLVEVKCPNIFLHAAVNLLKNGFSATFEIAGDGYMKNEIERFIANSGFKDKFILHGSVDQNQLAKLYCKASCTVLTSRSEGLPFVIIESLACGTPVVATNLPGLCEIVKNMDNGVLTPVNSPDETKNAIVEVCSWEKDMEAIAATVKNRTWENHAIKFKTLLTELLKR